MASPFLLLPGINLLGIAGAGLVAAIAAQGAEPVLAQVREFVTGDPEKKAREGSDYTDELLIIGGTVVILAAITGLVMKGSK